jgi:hypothetical protein
LGLYTRIYLDNCVKSRIFNVFFFYDMMKKLLSLSIAISVSFSTFPAVTTVGAKGATSKQQLSAISGRGQRADQEDRNATQAEIHIMLQKYLKDIHKQRSLARKNAVTDWRLRAMERELNISKDMQEILKKEEGMRSQLLSYYLTQPRVSRRILRERIEDRRKDERCLASDGCSLNDVSYDDESISIPQRSPSRSVLQRRVERSLKKISQEKSQEEENAPTPIARPRSLTRPLSPRHLWKKAEEQEREHDRRIAEIKERYGPKPTHIPPQF